MTQPTVLPYLFFSGRCEEALEFYQTAINASPGLQMRFSQSPDPLPEGMLQPGFENKIMHAEFRVGEMRVLVSDGCSSDAPHGFSGFRLALTVPTEEAAQQAFAGLSEEGVVDMPLSPTFWSPCYGQVTDKFGVGWMVMVPGEDSA